MKHIFIVLILLIFAIFSLQREVLYIKPSKRANFQVFQKEKLEKLLDFKILEEGTNNNNYFPKRGDLITGVCKYIHKGKYHKKKEDPIEISFRLGHLTPYEYCFNLVGPYLSKGAKVKFNCPMKIDLQPIIGHLPLKNIEIELKIDKIEKSWTEEEIINEFKVETLNEGDKQNYVRMEDIADLKEKIVYAKTGELLLEKDIKGVLIGDPQTGVDCYHLVVPIMSKEKKSRFFSIFIV